MSLTISEPYVSKNHGSMCTKAESRLSIMSNPTKSTTAPRMEYEIVLNVELKRNVRPIAEIKKTSVKTKD